MGGKVTAGPDVVTAVVASVVLGVAKSVVEDSDIGKWNQLLEYQKHKNLKVESQGRIYSKLTRNS